MIDKWKVVMIVSIIGNILLGIFLYKKLTEAPKEIEIVQVRKELSDMNKLLLSIDSISAKKVNPAIYKINKNYYEISKVQKVTADSVVNSINKLLRK